ncbi:uncharacterized protein LOC122278379 [Carya illinoinensis]|uniref:uncharacterized protein LOC122278379 n=1 Tax=Carya illinoinensis TaxID=32201 RepID=UPI001C718525|nr:uncharacterized protein LOC122278379 [Carya illinoinensis]
MVLTEEGSPQQILVTGFYGFPETSRRGESWSLLRLIKPREDKPWLCLGDFNEILHHHEKMGAASRPYSQMEAFRMSMDWCGLSDLGFEGSKFTWCNNREGDQFTKERLDRAMGNLMWSDLFCDCNISALAAQTSDHSPLLVIATKRGMRHSSFESRRKKIFRFEASWNVHEACNNIVKSTWSAQGSAQGPKMNLFMRKLKSCKESLKHWSSSLGKKQRDIQGQLKLLLRMQDSNMGSNTAAIKALQKEIDKSLEEENLRWQQRAKQLWLRDGDRNSKFFHKCANQRRKNNGILKLMRTDESFTTDLREISSLFSQYYQDLFTSSNPRGIEACLNQVHPRVDREMNANLTKQFSAEEVKCAIFHMNPMGSPGPDGYPALFYQSHWDIVGADLTDAVLEILNGNGNIAAINDTFIVLIPKIRCPQTVLDFRPISLCNVVYKVVSKVLSNRLKLILPYIIAQSQSAFIPGKMIMDNVIVAFETLHAMSTKGKGKQGYMAIKLDMSKAYDRVEWVFLRRVMGKMGFSNRWINLVMQCVTTVSYSLLINGSSQCSFIPTRGIRQGDPLSPYLFILVAEVLSSLMNHAESIKMIHGFPISRGKLSINHLFFADDSLIFCRANAGEWSSTQALLNLYEEASGQKLNKTKTSIFFSSSTKPAAREYILKLAGTRASSSYEKYLGLPALIGRSKNAAFKGITDRIRGRISNWKNKFLSQAGKEILLKAVIQALPTYCMGVFKLPKSLLNEINKIMHHYWWGHLQNEKRVHWVSWGQMGRSKSAGGLGFRDLESFNLALLAKQGWRIIQQPNSLAAQVLKLKYFPSVDFFQAKVGYRPSFIWRNFCAAKGLIEKGSIWRIGDGQSTKIWKDRWLPQPTSYRIQSPVNILLEDEKVARLINQETKQWDRGLITEVFGPEVAAEIQRIPLSSSGLMDKLIWLGSKDGSFTVKSAYHLQKELYAQLKGQSSRGLPRQRDWTDLWKMQIPNANKSFLWRACLEALPTKLNLCRKRIVDSPICPICCLEEETTTHALWNCISAMDVWSQSHIFFQKSSFRVDSFKDLFECLREQGTQPLMELFSVISRNIWLRRNKLVFEGSFMHPNLVVSQASLSLAAYKEAQGSRKSTPQASSTRMTGWYPPPSGSIKINWDAAVDVPQAKVGIGLVARDHEGRILVTKQLIISSIPDPLLAEGLGAFQAASLARDMEFSPVILEGDAVQIVNGINHQLERWDRVGMVMYDTGLVLSRLGQWSVVFVRRCGNQMAHNLAKDALRLEEDSVVVVFGPPCNHVALGTTIDIRVLVRAIQKIAVDRNQFLITPQRSSRQDGSVAANGIENEHRRSPHAPLEVGECGRDRNSGNASSSGCRSTVSNGKFEVEKFDGTSNFDM